ncbi:hypothetical protein HRW23_20910 [Streptomyces lunaelactis]|uniref:hypothetical protein n=2 Tax=Streptomyces lunaelactis TaxID=1535768 RepID=UPI001585AF4F|nr:hypothetical protein [Streptomyces lunaelactis]NUK03593.1 hypothetical protein [Streptomyces lunaelactis]NUK18016.1 hypothetical protein [Streptomyces lunaelactis]NUK25300.1 hypothetical protein [Streptomyces lunaelactis]NUK52183.1 hypothetical protein [Streptomyces lunaelactis]NUK58999.1 hypothetical protein [Streptomyces lunaelactis]
MKHALPRLDIKPLELPPLAGAADELWRLLLDLADVVDAPWTLVGGQMVMLHGLQRGRPSPRVSADIDTVVDVRADPRGMRRMVRALTKLGLVPAGDPGPNGLMHRYVKPGTEVAIDLAVPAASVDVLVPEGLGPTADVTTSGRGRAFPAPGASQALARTELVPVTYDSRQQHVPRPDLLGAIVGKAVGAAVDDKEPERHIRDLAFLCSLVEDPFALAESITPKDRKRLSRAVRKLSGTSPHWQGLDGRGDDARAVWEVLTSA